MRNLPPHWPPRPLKAIDQKSEGNLDMIVDDEMDEEKWGRMRERYCGGNGSNDRVGWRAKGWAQKNKIGWSLEKKKIMIGFDDNICVCI